MAVRTMTMLASVVPCYKVTLYQKDTASETKDCRVESKAFQHVAQIILPHNSELVFKCNHTFPLSCFQQSLYDNAILICPTCEGIDAKKLDSEPPKNTIGNDTKEKKLEKEASKAAEQIVRVTSTPTGPKYDIEALKQEQEAKRITMHFQYPDNSAAFIPADC